MFKLLIKKLITIWTELGHQIFAIFNTERFHITFLAILTSLNKE